MYNAKNKWLRGDNYVNIQCRIMVLVQCHSPDCHLSLNQVPFCTFQDIAQTGIHHDKYKVKGR